MNVRNENVDQLDQEQRMKAAVHYTVVKICHDVGRDLDVNINKQVMSAIAETTWRQLETYAQDLELFAKHGKRSTVSPEDVKLLVRKSPRLLEHINKLHKGLGSNKDESRKRATKGSKRKSEETDENSNLE